MNSAYHSEQYPHVNLVYPEVFVHRFIMSSFCHFLISGRLWRLLPVMFLLLLRTMLSVFVKQIRIRLGASSTAVLG